MGFLTDILNKVKRNTLDKTNLDERAYSLVANAAQSGKNFFTQTIPKIQKQATQNFDWAGQQAQENIVKPINRGLDQYDRTMTRWSQSPDPIPKFIGGASVNTGNSIIRENQFKASQPDMSLSKEGLDNFIKLKKLELSTKANATGAVAPFAFAPSTPLKVFLGSAGLGGAFNSVLNMAENARKEPSGNVATLPALERLVKGNSTAISRGAQQGAIQAPVINAVADITNPTINQAAGKVLEKFPQLGEKGQFIINRIIQGTMSIPEGYLMAKATGQDYNITNAAIDFLIGSGLAKKAGTVAFEGPYGNGEAGKIRIVPEKVSPEDVRLQEILDQRKIDNAVKPQPEMGINKSLLEKRAEALLKGQGTDLTELAPGDRKPLNFLENQDKERMSSLLKTEPPPPPPQPVEVPPQVRQPVTPDTKLQDIMPEGKPKVELTDFETRKESGRVASERAKQVAQDKPFVDRVLSGNLQQKEVNKIRATKLIEPITKVAVKDGDAFMKAVQDPKLQENLPQYKGIFDYVSGLTKKAYQVATDAGIKMQQQVNYFPQKWKTELANEFKVGQRTLSKKFGNAKGKVIESIAKGQELGYEYYFDSPAEALEHYIRYMKNTITNWETVDSLRRSGALVPGAVAEGQPGMVKVEAYGLPVSSHGTAPDGTAGYGGGWYAEESLAKKLNTIFGDKGVNKKLGMVAGIFKRGQDWILSGGIPGTAANFFTAVQALYKDLPISLSNPEHLRTVARSLFEGRTNNSANKVFSEHSGTLIRMAQNDISNPSSYSAKTLVENGLIDTFIERQGNIADKFVGTFDKLLNDPTFKRHMALKKLFMFEDYSRQFQAKGMTQVDADAVAAKVVKGFFGEDSMIKRALENKNGEAFKTIMAMAHKYREGIIGTGRYIGQSVLPKNWKDPTFTTGRQLLLGSIILQLGGEALNYALNGNFSADNETSLKGKVKIPIGKMMGYTDEKKDLVFGLALPTHSSLTALPRSIIKTGGELLQGKVADATDTMIGNASVVAQPFLRTMTNRDAFGNQIVGENDANKGSKVLKTFSDTYTQPLIKGITQITKAEDDISAIKASAQMLEMPFRVYSQKALNSSHYYEGMDKVKQGMDPAALKDWEATRRTKTGEFASDFADEAAKANIYLRRPELLDKERQVAEYVSQKTGQPINPLLLLDKEKQMVIMRMKTLPPGTDKSALYKMNEAWLPAYYDALTKYSEKMVESGVFKDTSATPKSEDFAPIKVSPELQKKLDYYNTLPSGTGARSAFLRANPDVSEYFQTTTDISNEKRAALGLPPKESSYNQFAPYQKKTSPEQTLLSSLLATSNKSRAASIASRKKLSAITKESNSGSDSIKKKLLSKKTKVSDKPILKTKIKT